MGTSRLVAPVAALCLYAGTLPAASASDGPSVIASWRAEPAASAVAVSADGRIYTVQTVRDAKQRVILRAFAADGSPLWSREWRPAKAWTWGHDVAVGPGGLVIVTGGVQAACGGDRIWDWGWAIRAWDPDGTVRWQRTQPGWRTCSVFNTRGTSVATVGDTVAMVATQTSEYSASASVLAFDPDHGRLRWEKPLRVPGSENGFVSDVAVGPHGAIYVGGTSGVSTFDSPEQDQDAVLAKLRTDGSVAWRRYGPDPNSGADGDRGVGVVTTRSGVYFLARLNVPGSRARGVLVRYRSNGEIRWSRSLPRGRGLDLTSIADGSILAGVAPVADGTGTRIALRRLGASGSRIWGPRLGPTSEERWGPYDIEADSGYVVLLGGIANHHGRNRVWVIGA